MAAKGRRAAPDAAFSLPDLTPFDGAALEARRDYDAISFIDIDLSGQDAPDGRFLESRFERCGLDALSLRRARIVSSLIEVDLSGARLRSLVGVDVRS